jgi:hypothetical protein
LEQPSLWQRLRWYPHPPATNVPTTMKSLFHGMRRANIGAGRKAACLAVGFGSGAAVGLSSQHQLQVAACDGSAPLLAAAVAGGAALGWFFKPSDKLTGYAEARMAEAVKRGVVIESVLTEHAADMMKKIEYNLERSTLIFKEGTSNAKDLEVKKRVFFAMMGVLSDPCVTADYETTARLDVGSVNVKALAHDATKKMLLASMSESPNTSIDYLKPQWGGGSTGAPYNIVASIISVADVWDADGDGVLTASEACSAVLLIAEVMYGDQSSPEASMGALFAAIDEDGDGSINAQELYTFLLVCIKLGRLTDEVVGMLKKEVCAHVSDVSLTRLLCHAQT